uniref:N-acetyltransferase domain-containing protein n=1 Tax=Chaetoceros debilis TaxID=122233 RepID=A0A7S3QJF7_9STRA|mmetsp:Transcript_11530/g.17521  ORF Transcript_11530/g.17521 Transcript_11530/m.17521 type:complete len:587 (+) Transcript_11530:356-2116(+)|eukprot:CAMPEP_0194117734 /NCGR_PEP_ID=MMETSP0150-20130528/32561_1 /TAXON_ID=122233 /ORGANISM="Chaetoceros debilis, Strain MM31A-1" /LENGTH=586 /DNA_ID=CAMNT_0038808869 /DNA_START=280 /DNA_END=2040 /DNA_ORIENTATION=-
MTSSKDIDIIFRNVCPTDLAYIYALEKASYPADEAASRSQLQYRQHHAAAFFRCAVVLDSKNTEGIENRITASHDADLINVEANRTSLNGMGEIIGFITASRCRSFDEESMKTHDPTGKLLAIHSVVVNEKYRKRGIGSKMMKNYLESLKKMELKRGIDKVVLISKKKNLMFYLDAGFVIKGKSNIVHGEENWYDCECEVNLKGVGKRTGMVGNVGKVARRGRFGNKYPYSVIDSFAVNSSGGSNSSSRSLPYSIESKMSGTDAGIPGDVAVVASGKGTGNPAAVVVIPDESNAFDPTSEDDIVWMRTVAREFNLSETAFIWESNQKDKVENSGSDTVESTFNIRYYTCNGTEVDLCGHATLAASLVVFQDLFSRGDRSPSVVFHTKQGVQLRAHPVNPNANIIMNSSIRIVMDLPSKQVVSLGDDSSAIMQMLKDSLFLNNSAEEIESIVKYIGIDDGGDDLLIELSSDGFTSIPLSNGINFGPMLNYLGYKRGVIVCCQNLEDLSERVDFYSRFFGPKVGIEEDPVTGSAHCVLATYFAEKLERDFVVGMQKSGRGGIVECTIADGHVRIAGSAVTTMSGTLYI